MLIPLIFWLATCSFIVLATIAAWLPNHKLMLVALVLSLPSTLYVIGGSNGWSQLAGLYIPMSLLLSFWLIRKKHLALPRVMLLPIYWLFASLGYFVYTQ